MVIGQLYLMHPKTELKSNEKSSIIISGDKLTYFSSENSTPVSFDTISLNDSRFFLDWINKNKINNDTQLIVSNTPGLFIPNAIFDKNMIKEYYDMFDILKKSDSLFTNLSSNHLNYIIFKLSNDFLRLKKKYLNNSIIIHYQTILYNYLISKNKNNNQKKIYINIQKESFEIFLFFGEQLILVNRYLNKGPESFLYFLYYIVEKNELSENDFYISFLGQYLNYEEYYNGAKLFHNKIEFIKESDQTKFINSSTPFLKDLYAYNFWNS